MLFCHSFQQQFCDATPGLRKEYPVLLKKVKPISQIWWRCCFQWWISWCLVGLLASAFIQLNHPSHRDDVPWKCSPGATSKNSRRQRSALAVPSSIPQAGEEFCGEVFHNGGENRWNQIFLSWLVLDFPLLIWRFLVLPPWSQSFRFIFCVLRCVVGWKSAPQLRQLHWIHFLARVVSSTSCGIKKKGVVQQILSVEKWYEISWEFGVFLGKCDHSFNHWSYGLKIGWLCVLSRPLNPYRTDRGDENNLIGRIKQGSTVGYV